MTYKSFCSENTDPAGAGADGATAKSPFFSVGSGWSRGVAADASPDTIQCQGS